MSTLDNQIVFITGASAGIGEACARAFAAAGARLMLCARRIDRLHELAEELKDAHGTESLVFELNVRDRDDVANTIESLPNEWKAIDVLVNNAGLSRGLDKLWNGLSSDWDDMIDTNVKGLLYVTRAVVPGMIARGKGFVINIGSIAGHQTYPNGNVYCASKRAVAAITDGLRQDLFGTPIRVATVDPGLCETEFSVVRFHGDKDRADKVYDNLDPLTAGDVAETVLFVATRPPHVTLQEVVIMPTCQPVATMVHRGELK